MNTFSAWDYVVFIALLLISAAIGLYHACFGKKQRTASEFLKASQSMGVFPVTMTLLASFMSAITMLGLPAEVTVYGTHYWMICVGYVLMTPLAAHVFVPVFYKLQVTSVFEVSSSNFFINLLLIYCVILCSIFYATDQVIYWPAELSDAIKKLERYIN